MRDSITLESAIRHASAVFHLAAQVAVTTSLADPLYDFTVNAVGTLNVLQSIRKTGRAIPLIFTSTNKVYGKLRGVALRKGKRVYEPVDPRIRAHGIDETQPLDFCSPYGCSKGAADQYVLDHAEAFGIPAAVFRMSCIYGPHQFGTEDQGWLAHFLIQVRRGRPVTIYGDGCQVRDVLFVADLVRAFELAEQNIETISGQAFNIGGGPARTTSLLQVLEDISRLEVGDPVIDHEDWRLGDQPYYVSNTAKFQKATGWTPTISLREGLARLNGWLAENEKNGDAVAGLDGGGGCVTVYPRRVLMTADAVGGVWTYALDLIEGLRPRGIEFFLAIMGPAPSESQRAALDRLPNLCWEHRPCDLEWMDDPWADVDAAGEWLMEFQKSFRPDLVHLNGYVHAALPWRAPVVVVAHSCVRTWWRAVKGTSAPTRYSVYRQRVKAGLDRAELVIAPTLAMMKSLESEYGPVRAKKIIHNGRPEADFLARRKSTFVFSAGRLWDEAKNFSLLDHIAPQLPWPVYAAGDTVSPACLPHLHKLDHLASGRMRSVLAEAAIYAAPAFYEPFGLAVLEAALSGCALVLADIPTFRELWDGAALFAPPDDASAWSDVLQRLIKNEDECREYGARARQRGERYGRERMLKQYGEEYAAQINEPLVRVAA